MRILGTWLLALIVLAAPALAVGGEGHSDTWLGIPRALILLFNLALFLGIIGYFAGPAVIRFLEGKGRDLRHSLEEAERQRREAEAMSDKLAAQIAELEREVEALRGRAASEGERERQEILAAAERERQRLQAQTREEVEHRLNQARQELTRHAVSLAARLAEERILTSLGPGDQRRLFDANLVRLEKK